MRQMDGRCGFVGQMEAADDFLLFDFAGIEADFVTAAICVRTLKTRMTKCNIYRHHENLQNVQWLFKLFNGS